MIDEVRPLKEHLEEITRTMDVPDFRRVSVQWLLRNMVVRNSGHPQFEEAMEILKKLAGMGVA
jgi:hypothetical protein